MLIQWASVNHFLVFFLADAQADVALLHDTALVILDAFSRLLKNKPDIFRNNTRRGEIYNRGQRGVDCQGNPTVPWEHGEVIVDYLRSVSYCWAKSSVISRSPLVTFHLP